MRPNREDVEALRRFNLLATCGRDVEFEAVFELKRLLSLVGDAEGEAWESGVKGLIIGSTGLEPREAIDRLRSLLLEDPWEFNVLRRIIPIERVVETDLAKIGEACREIAAGIKAEDTFRVTVEKRRARLGSREVIEEAARHVKARVDLEKPDKIILIEIVGGQTGISLLEGERDILNVTRDILEA